MKFSHPELLYALFLLLIPVLVHLFRLRKFKKEDFTNVKFLHRISVRTRKSSQLKKWLILATRILLLACIVFAFAGPFFPRDSSKEKNRNLIIYLDNSYSMQARGEHGPLLERSIQELISNLPQGEEIDLFTNNNTYKNITRSDLQKIEYTSAQLDYKAVLLKAQHLQNTTFQSKLLIVSDFPEDFIKDSDTSNTNLKVFLLPLQPETRNNQTIDTAFLAGSNPEKKLLHIKISRNGNSQQNSVSVYNGKNLLGKTGIVYASENSEDVEFPLETDSLWQGKIEIEDNGLQFDNSLFFSLNKSQPVRVVSINNEDDDFLKRIFNPAEFHYSAMAANRVDFSQLAEAQVIILNEIKEFPSSLKTLLQQKIDQQTVFLIIPPASSPGANYTDFLRKNGFPVFEKIENQERSITGISFNHPLYAGVFEEEISNFDYPKVRSYYRVTSTPGIIRYEDQSAFLFKKANTYIFTAPLNKGNSNFVQSPLIVPTFFNIGLSAVQPSKLFYQMNSSSFFDVPIKIDNDKVLHLTSDNINIIPEQQRFSDKVRIFTENLDLPPGNYMITNQDEPVMAVSFNIDRKESKMEFAVPKNNHFSTIKNVKDFISSASFGKEEPEVWKWFVIFAVFFLVIETLLLKYIK
ncbi:MAG: BatA domain-containing protein [Gillisia sp.]